MTDRPVDGPMYLSSGGAAVFGTFHAATLASPGTAVLICPPWGWEEVTSYRARRAWAERLSAAGHPTLRMDLPGSGDSAGSPADLGLVAAWRDAVTTGTTWLAGIEGVRRVAAIGLGLGGLVAGQAIAAGAPVDDLVLWATPTRGRTFLREQRAFAAMQSARYSLTGEPEPAVLPEGWVEVGGFVLSSTTIEALETVDLTELRFPGLRRTLLLERDGMRVDPDLRSHLDDGEIETTAAPGPGWADMVFHPERYSPPIAVFDRVQAWLAGATAAEKVLAETAPAKVRTTVSSSGWLDLDEGGVPIRETPIWIEQSSGRRFGILTEPQALSPGSPAVAFLNAGAVRRIGPNRLWVESARQLAAIGISSVRMDMEGIGDADGDPLRFRDVGNFYTLEFGTGVGATMDALEARGLGPRFALVGLCAGGYWAFNAVADDRRVEQAIVLNPRALVWDASLTTERDARKASRILEPSLWSQVLRGEIHPSRGIAVTEAVARRSARTARRALTRYTGGRRLPSSTNPVVARLDDMQDLGGRLTLAFSAEEPVHDELAASGVLAAMEARADVRLVTLPGRDHTVRPMAAQRAVLSLIVDEISTGGPDDRR